MLKPSDQANGYPDGVSYDRAFDTVVNRAWKALSQEDRERASSRQGDLNHDDPPSYAIRDTHNYQRSHADAFKKAMTHVSIESPSPEQTMAVIDIGGGAATVAVAISEAWPDHMAQISYHLIEPHEAMRKLGRKLLSAMGVPFDRTSFHRSVEKFRRGYSEVKADRVLVTFSYVLHQSAVRDSDVDEWVELIQHLVHLRPHQVAVLATTAESSNPNMMQRDKTGRMREGVDALEPSLRYDTGRLRCGRRFPSDDPANGVAWSSYPSEYGNVRYVYWHQSSPRDPWISS